MHALKLILEDHEKIRNLFAKIDNTLLGTSDKQAIHSRKLLFEELSPELLKHETMEQTFFYPFIRHHEPFKDQIKQLIHKEKEIPILLANFKGLPIASEDWIKQYHKLKYVMDKHLTEEEMKLFPKVKAIISEKLLNDMGAQMHEYKKNAHVHRLRYQ